MIKKVLIVCLVITLFATGAYAQFGRNDGIGDYFIAFFPFRDSTVNTLWTYFSEHFEDITVNQTTVLDVDDEMYLNNPDLYNIGIPQLIELERTVYLEEAWSGVLRRDWFYMNALDGHKVQCKPSDDNLNGIPEPEDTDGIYEMLCVRF